MALQTMIDNLNAARKKYNEQLDAIGETAQTEVGKFLAPFVPKGWSVVWKQYTPHFNDGDACHFSVREPYLVKLDDKKPGIPRCAEAAGGMEFGTALKRYGKPDETKTYETTDYDKVLSAPGVWPRTYARKTVSYIDPGFPAIEGYPVERLRELADAWSALPEDLLENAFGDHARCRVTFDGTTEVVEHEHD